MHEALSSEERADLEHHIEQAMQLDAQRNQAQRIQNSLSTEVINEIPPNPTFTTVAAEFKKKEQQIRSSGLDHDEVEELLIRLAEKRSEALEGLL